MSADDPKRTLSVRMKRPGQNRGFKNGGPGQGHFTLLQCRAVDSQALLDGGRDSRECSIQI